MFEGFEGLGELFLKKFPKRIPRIPRVPYSPDCSVRLMISSWRERERVVKSAL